MFSLIAILADVDIIAFSARAGVIMFTLCTALISESVLILSCSWLEYD